MKKSDLMEAVKLLATDAAKIQQQIEEDLAKSKKRDELIGQVEYLQKQLTWVSAFMDQSLTMIDPLQMLSIQEVCKKLRIGKNTLMPWITIGALKVSHSGDQYLISRPNLAAFEQLIEGIDLLSQDDLYRVEQTLKKTVI